MDDVSDLLLQHPALGALIKLELSNSILRLQLGEDPSDSLKSRLNDILADNTMLVQRLAGKDQLVGNRPKEDDDLPQLSRKDSRSRTTSNEDAKVRNVIKEDMPRKVYASKDAKLKR